jgi:hypothetical protein
MDVLIGLHSLWRWVVLIVVLVAIVRGLIGWLRGGNWTANDRMLALASTIVVDIQLVLGLLVYITAKGWKLGAFLAYVHPLIMIIAIAVIHIASVRIRRAETPVAKHRTLALGLILAMVLITAAIPSDAWSRAWHA